MNNEVRNRPVPLEITGIPTSYIRAKYIFAPVHREIQMAGFEGGKPNPVIETDQFTGEKKFVIRLNGYLTIEKGGDCLILDTTFNRKKLRILTRHGKIKKPNNSSGSSFTEVKTKPMFQVYDESIFEDLENEVGTVPKKRPRNSKALVSADEVEAERLRKEMEKADGKDGTGGGRRPDEMVAPDGTASAPETTVENLPTVED